MKYAIALPLIVLFILGMLSVLGVTETVGTFGNSSVSTDGFNAVYYDSAGAPKVFIANLTAVSEYGQIVNVAGKANWVNTTGLIQLAYPLYFDSYATHALPFEDVGETEISSFGGEFSLSSSLGFVALVVALMALAIVVGLRILGSGTSSISVSLMITGTFYLALWGVFSVMSLELLSALDVLGYILYLGLTLLYTVGIISSATGGGDND